MNSRTSRFVAFFLLLTLLSFADLLAGLKQITSNLGWSGAGIGSTDSVVVENGAGLYIDVASATCQSITLGGNDAGIGGNGLLQFNSGGNTLTINGTLTVGDGTNSRTGTVNMTNTGTLIVTYFATNNGAGSSLQVLTTGGQGTIQVKGTTTLLPGFTTYNSLAINASGGVVSGAGNISANFLSLQAGTFSPGASNTVTINASCNVTSTGGTIDATSGGGTVQFNGSNTVSGTVDFYNVSVTSNYIDFGTAATVHGTFSLNSGSYVNNTHPPIYAVGSTLQYNVTYGVFSEWAAGTSGTGVPYNVTINANTVTTPSAAARTARGSVTITTSGTLTLANDLNVGGNFTKQGSGTFNPSSKAVFFNGTGTQTITGPTSGANVAFDYFIVSNTGGSVVLSSVTPTNCSASAPGGGAGLQMNGSGTLDLNGNTFYVNSGSASNIQTSGGARSITSSLAGAVFAVQNSTKTVTSVSSGTLSFGSNVTVNLTNGLDCGSGLTTINGILQINGGGFITNNAPTYASGSTLNYNNGATYGTGTEWLTGSSGAGIPQNVHISTSGTSANFGAATSARTAKGNVTIDASTTLSVSTASGGDLNIGGSLTNNGTLNSTGTYGRQVAFNGSSAATIGGSGSTSFDYLQINDAGGITLNSAITVNDRIQLVAGAVSNASHNVTLTSGCLIEQTAGSLSNVPVFGGTVSNSYFGSSFSTGPELPTSTTAEQTLLINASGTITLAAGLKVNNAVTLTAGTLALGSQTLELAAGKNLSSGGGSLSGGTVQFDGTNVVSGTLAFNNVSLSGGVDFGTSSSVAGTMTINAGGFVSNSHPPAYGGSSTLTYNIGAAYGAGGEWNTGVASGVGVPQNVLVTSAGTSLNFGAAAAYRQANGNLEITNGATLSLSTASGGDLKVGGNFTVDGGGSFTGNTRAVFFTGTSATQVVSGSSLSIPYILVPNAGVTLQLGSGTSLTVSTDNGGNGLSLTSSSSVFDLNGQSVTFSRGAFTGSGQIKGSSTSNLTINDVSGADGAFGTLTFASGSQSLNNLTVSRPSGSVTLGSPLTVGGTLTLTNGLVNTGANTLTIGPSGSLSGSGSTAYVHGNLAYALASSGSPTLNFAIGDGANYTPVSVAMNTLTGSGTLTATTTAGAEPNLGSAAQINSSKMANRYWTITNSGATFTNYAATFNFVSGDLIGGANTSNFVVGKYSSGSWSFPTVGTRTSTSTQGTGLTSFSDFVVAEGQTFTITATAAANGSISPNGVTNVSYGGSQSYTITPNTGYSIDSVVVNGVNQGVITSYNFTNVTANSTINAYFAINTYTLTSSAGANGSISPNGGTVVNYGANQIYTVTPNGGYHIDSILVDGSYVGNTSPDTIKNVAANHTISVTFQINSYTITASAGANGSISPSGSVGVSSGGSQQFTFTPNTGYHIDSVLVDGAYVGNTSPYTVSNVTANHTISVTYGINSYTLTSSAGANGSISPNGTTNVNYGSNQIYTVTPNTGYHIDSILVDGSYVGNTSPDTLKNVAANHTITALFGINSYTITASSGSNGNISPSGSVNVNYGGSQVFTMTPNTGYHIDSVLVDGAYVGNTSPDTISSVSANHTIAVTYGINMYTIIATSSAHGSISPSGTTNVNYNGSQAYTITANSGYHISDVQVDGTSVGAQSSYTFSSVVANHTINANFVSDTTAAGVVINGTVAAGEYGSDTDGHNQQTSGATVWHMTWDSTALYIGITGANIAEGAVAYINGNPQVPINSGTNANGTNIGNNYDGVNFASLPFRANLVTYFKNGYREYRTSTGSNTWSSATTNFGSYADNSGSATREVAIPWSTIGGFPSSFAFFGYVASSGGFVYGQVPVADGSGTIGTSAEYGRYYIVNTTNGTIKPFSRDSYVFNSPSDLTGFGAISVYDFTMNSSGRTLTRATGAGGAWTIAGCFNVNAGTIDFGSSTNSAIVSGAVKIGSSGTLKLSTAPGGDLNVNGNFTNNGGTFTTNNRALGFYGTSAQTITGVSALDYATLNNSAGLTLGNNVTINQTLTLTSGNITTGSDTLAISSTGSVSRTSGYIYGNLAKTLPTGTAVNQTYEIGDATTYAPVNLTFATVSTGGTLTANTVGSAHPQLATSGINTSKKVNRYWTVSNNGAAFTTYNATLNFAAGDLDGGANTNNFAVRKYDSPNWSSPLTGTRTSTSTQAKGMTSFSDFAVGEVPTYTITASAGAHGSISPSGSVTVVQGDSASFTITPSSGYHIDTVYIDGVASGNPSSYAFASVSAAHTISAVFAINSYTITASAGSNGGISPSGSVGVSSGGSQSFTITPNTGYHIDSVMVDGAYAGNTSPYNFTNVTASHTISATFGINAYVIIARSGPNGSIAPSGNDTVTYGANATFNFTPATGYRVDSVLVDSVLQSISSSYTFSSVAANHSICVKFGVITDTITASAGANGAISPSGSVPVTYGTNQIFNVTPNTGYHIDSVLVDGAYVGNASPDTIKNVTANHTISALFGINTYTLTTSAGSNGTISPAGPLTVNYGSSQSFTVAGNAGYKIDSIFLDGSYYGKTSPVSLTGISANHLVSATFTGDTSAAGVVVNGTIGSGEYGSDVDGQNQQTSGGAVWHLTWDSTSLYIGISGATISEGAVIYLDNSVQVPINAGTNTNGTNVGQNYDGVNFASLPFRAGLVAYFKNGYREYRTSNGSNGWSGATTGFGEYADNGTTNTREVSIPWSAVGGFPSSFGFFGYLSSSAGFVYGQVPVENLSGTIGTSAEYGRYYILKTNGTVKPFSRDSYVFNSPTDITTFGAITAYDFTMNSSGRTITRTTGAGGVWTINGCLNVNAGTIDFGSSTNSANVSGAVKIGSSGTLKLSSAAGGDLNVNGNLSNSGGTFTTNNRAVGFNGTNAQTVTGVSSLDYASLNNSAGLTLGNNLTVNQTLTLTAGNITTGADTLTIGSTGSVSRTGGYVYGNLAKVFGTGSAVNKTFEIGDAITYAPVTINFASITTGGTLTANTTSGAHPQIATSGLMTSKKVNRYWTVSNSGAVFTTYDATLNFVSGDIDAGANTGYFAVRKYDSPNWSSPLTGTRTSTSTQAKGMTSFSDFAVGQVPTYSITASASSGGTITPSGTVTVVQGDSSTFAIAANNGFNYDSLLVDGSKVGTPASYSFANVSANHTISAYFSTSAYVITASSGANGSISPSGSVGVNSGGSQSFTFTPSTGYHIDSVLVDGAYVQNTSPYNFTNVMAGHTISVTFGINSYTLTASAGANGAISPSGATSVNYNGSQIYAVTPNTGYHIDSILVDGAFVGSTSPDTVKNVSANHTVTATFGINTYTITTSAGANGTISPVGPVTVNYGGSQSFTVASNSGYKIDSIFLDGVYYGKTSPVSLTSISANHLVAATFTGDTSAAGVVINGTIAAGEYGTDVDGQNQETSSGTVWHLTWDSTALYVGISSATISEGAVMYIDNAVQVPINSGTNANGTSVGQNYDGVNFSSLPFRAGLVAYAKNGYREYRTSNGSNGWSGATTSFGEYADNSGTSSREFSIPWSAMGGEPTSFAFFGYVASSAGFVYGQVPSADASGPIGTSASYGRYYIVNTTNGSVKPFSHDSYVYNNVADLTNFGAISVYDFTMNSSGRTITRASGAGGAWNIAGCLNVNAGTIDGGASSTAVSVTGNVKIGSAGTLKLSAAVGGDLNLNRNLSNNGGTLVTNGRAVGFYGTTAQTSSGVSSFDYLTLSNSAGLTLANSATINNTLTLNSGNIRMGVDTLTLGPNGAVSRTSGNVVGYLAKTVPTGSNVSTTFEIGDSANYTPATVTFASVTSGGVLTATTTDGAHPQLASSGLNTSEKVNRYWTLSNAGTAFTTYNATFTFASSDLDAGANSTFFAVRKYDAPTWSAPVTGTRTSTSTQATGMTGFSDFAIGQASIYTISASSSANGSISPTGIDTVVQGDSARFTMTPETGYHVVDLVIDSVTSAAANAYTFTNVSRNHTIKADFGINTYTITSSAGANGSISPAGSTVVNYGANAIYHFTPNANYHVDSVIVDGVLTAATNPDTLKAVAANHTIRVTFAINKYIISASTGPNGHISPTGNDTVAYGSNVVFTISPNTGYHVDSLLVDGVEVTPTLSDTIKNVSANHTIYAIFKINTYSIVANAGTHGTISPSGSTTLNYGATQVYTITPDTGYHVDSLIVDGVPQTPAVTDTFKNVAANHNIRATFKINTYILAATAGANGAITPSGNISVTYLGRQIFRFTPSVGYTIDSLVVDGVLLSPVAADTFNNVNANHTIHVTFKPISFTITASAGSNGTIAPSGAVVVNYGANRAFTMTADSGYTFDSLIVDGISVGIRSAYTFVNVTANHTILAQFKLAPDTSTKYRTFTYDSLIVKKAVVKKNIGSYFAFTIVDTVAADSVFNIKFKNKITSITSASGLTVTQSKSSWSFTGRPANDTLTIIGYSSSTKEQLIAGLWLGPVKGSANIKNIAPTAWRDDLPMPNAATLYDYAFASGAFDATRGFVVGVPVPADAKQYGWVVMGKGTQFYASLIDKTGKHTQIADGFNFTKQQTSLPPHKQNNLVFADLIALKFNIALSQLGTTQPGFGELRFRKAGNPFDGLLVSEIAGRCDTMMTYSSLYPAADYDSVDLAMQMINSAFSGPIDTLKWSDTLKLTGVASLAQVSFLTPSGIAPVTVKQASSPTAASDLPKTVKLEQNYPNPFNPVTSIRFELPAKSVVTLKVYNVLGQVVTTLVDHGSLEEGSHELQFNGANFASGVYFYRLEAEGDAKKTVAVMKMLLVK